MTVDNFNWFLHCLLFIHTQRVINKQREKAKKRREEKRMRMRMKELILKRMKSRYVDKNIESIIYDVSYKCVQGTDAVRYMEFM